MADTNRNASNEPRRHDKPQSTPKQALRLHTLYLGDNGRVFCGDLQCAGSTAYFTGRDLSGQKLVAISPKTLDMVPQFRCESCGMRPEAKS